MAGQVARALPLLLLLGAWAQCRPWALREAQQVARALLLLLLLPLLLRLLRLLLLPPPLAGSLLLLLLVLLLLLPLAGAQQWAW